MKRQGDGDRRPDVTDTFEFIFGGAYLARRVAEDNFLLAGQRGSGKTLSLRLLAQKVIEAFYENSGRRALVYDPKGDWPSIVSGILHGLGPVEGHPFRSEIWNLNPFDIMGYAYDLAADFETTGERGRPLSAAADGLAKSLIPDNGLGAENRFWVSSAQNVVSGIVQVFAKYASGEWTLRDVVSAACDRDLVEIVLGHDPMAGRVLDRLSKPSETYANVLQTVASFVWDLEPAATAWDHHLREGRGFTCRDWFDSENILILCGSYDPPSAVEPINGVIMNCIREHMLTRPEVKWNDPTHPDYSETWFFLDEFPKLHKIRDITDFFTLTRSKGGIQVIAFQSVADIYARYGQQSGDTILGLCGILGILRLTCPKTAEYFEHRIGSYEVERLYRTSAVSEGYSSGDDQTTYNWSKTISELRQYHLLQGVLRQQFHMLPPVDRDLTVEGYFLLHGQYSRKRYSVKQLELAVPDADYLDFVALPLRHVEPRPWVQADFDRLKIPPGDYLTKRARRSAPSPADLLREAKRWRT